jgi:hypothetical protein
LRSRTTRRFRTAFSRIPGSVKERAREAYQRFVENPDHPGSRSKLIRSAEPIYSVRVTRDYGALGLREDDTIIWSWIGSHVDYDGLISPMLGNTFVVWQRNYLVNYPPTS